MKAYTYISFGAGVQSTAMLICSNLGLHGVPRADSAIFADTQNEPGWVYEQFDVMQTWSKIPVHKCTAGDLLLDGVAAAAGKTKRWGSIPLWTRGQDGHAAPLRRQCTREYKVEPIDKYVRMLMGYQPGQHVKHSVRCLIGISRDEVIRMKPSRTRWCTNEWPLVDAGLTRLDCARLVEEHGFAKPKRSACVFCPYHSDSEWLMMKRDAPDEFARAVKADETMRNMEGAGVENPTFMHRSLKPLARIDFEQLAGQPLFESNDFGNECEGMCGV